MRYSTSVWAYCRAMFAQWFTAMSGPIAVPLGIASYFVEPTSIKLPLVATAIAAFVFSSYWVWRIERKYRNKEGNRDDLTGIKGRIIQSGSNYDVTADDNFLAVRFSEAGQTNINMPTNPHENHRIEIKAAMDEFWNHPIYIFGNGNKIDGHDRYVMQFGRSSFSFIFLGGEWRIT